jgi:hypothetical protein
MGSLGGPEATVQELEKAEVSQAAKGTSRVTPMDTPPEGVRLARYFEDLLFHSGDLPVREFVQQMPLHGLEAMWRMHVRQETILSPNLAAIIGAEMNKRINWPREIRPIPPADGGLE